MLFAEGRQVVDCEIVLLGQFGHCHVRHHDVAQEFFLFLLNQPLLGRDSENVVELALKARGRHVQQVNQLFYGTHLGIALHHLALEIVVLAQNGGKEVGKVFFGIEAAQFHEQNFRLDVLKVDAREARVQYVAGYRQLSGQQMMDGQQREAGPGGHGGADVVLQLFDREPVAQGNVSREGTAHEYGIGKGAHIKIVARRYQKHLSGHHLPVDGHARRHADFSLEHKDQRGTLHPLPDKMFTCFQLEDTPEGSLVGNVVFAHEVFFPVFQFVCCVLHRHFVSNNPCRSSSDEEED